MPTSSITSRIHQLDGLVANQIAAGEVVERPASVLKELIENSLDAGATRIEVEVELGGTRLIRVRDNGCGIHPDDMVLALSRHATSKIHASSDLEAITSLGFRGEALASISAVSHLTLTSRWHQADSAWQGRADGQEMAVSIVPASLNAGTQVEVRELFFNVPARRRFLRTERTEMHRIETLLSCLALSRSDVTFHLRHNQRSVRRLNGVLDRAGQEQRVGQILGREFLAHALYFELQHDGIELSGWLGLPEYHRSHNDGQYVYVNRRNIRDRVVNHAIREAYAGLLPTGRLAAYVLFLGLSPATIDVNVHPTKHEVRFHQGRQVHDFLTRALKQVLQSPQASSPPAVAATAAGKLALADLVPKSPAGASKVENYRSTPISTRSPAGAAPIAEAAAVYRSLLAQGALNQETEISAATASTPGRFGSSGLVEGQYLLLQFEASVWLVSLREFIRVALVRLWQEWREETTSPMVPLLFPERLILNSEHRASKASTEPKLAALHRAQSELLSFGLDLQLDQQRHELVLLAVATPLVNLPARALLSAIVDCHQPMAEYPREWLAKLLQTVANESNTPSSYARCARLDSAQGLETWLGQYWPEEPRLDEGFVRLSAHRLATLFSTGSTAAGE